ncbi:hypothetical protein C4J92_3582 [Pseudomonas sp. R3-18-08]|nr:hypothetical protein C4J92_3582 [Pseudomonas sp. R3-18-08]
MFLSCFSNFLYCIQDHTQRRASVRFTLEEVSQLFRLTM